MWLKHGVRAASSPLPHPMRKALSGPLAAPPPCGQLISSFHSHSVFHRHTSHSAGGETEAQSRKWLVQGHRARKWQTPGGSDLGWGCCTQWGTTGVPGASTTPASHPGRPGCCGHPGQPSPGPAVLGWAGRQRWSGRQNWPLNTSAISCRAGSLFAGARGAGPRH